MQDGIDIYHTLEISFAYILVLTENMALKGGDYK